MRLLLTTDAVGGVWTFTQELTAGLLEAGHQVCLLCFGVEPSMTQRAEMHVLQEGAPSLFSFHHSLAPLEWMEGNERTWSEGSAFLESLIEVFQPDVVHANQLCWGMVGGGRPTLVTAHSDVLSWAAATLPGGIAELESNSDVSWLTRYRKLVQDGLAWADEVTAPSAWMAERVEQIYATGRRPAVVLNGRTLLTCMDPVVRSLQAVTSGRLWDRAKGLDILQEVTPSMPILLVGSADFQGSTAELPKQVRSLGRLPEQQLHQVFRASSVYLGTSVYEPFGLAPLEAALCGCALLLRDIPTFRELWDGAALFFTTSTEFEQQLQSLAENTSMLRARQDAALARAQEYSAARMTEQYLGRYQRLAQQFGRFPDQPPSEDYAA